MRVIFAHAPQANSREMRQILVGSGLECGAQDCVTWNDLPSRLGHGDADLVLVGVDQTEHRSWDAIQGVRALTTAPVMAIGAHSDDRLLSRLREIGISEVLDAANLSEALDDALERSLMSGALTGRRGKVISVFAPTPGSGGTTVASNLAGALARRHPGRVALIELSKESSDLAVMLDLNSTFSAGEVCRRWRTLDTTTLENSFAEHPTGLHVLANDPEADNEYLDRRSVRRTAILTRVCRDYSILALDGHLSESEIEAMRLSDVVVLVVRPDVLAVRRAFRALERLIKGGIPRERFQLVMNRIGQRGQLPLRQVESIIGMRAVALVPDDARSANRAMNQGALIVESGKFRKINRVLRSLAKQLERTSTTKRST